MSADPEELVETFSLREVAMMVSICAQLNPENAMTPEAKAVVHRCKAVKETCKVRSVAISVV